MKNIKTIIIIVMLIFSIALNIVLSIYLVNIKTISNNNIKNIEKGNYYGLYQTSYYNNYNKQIILTIRLNEDGTCRYGESAAEYASEGTSECLYDVNGKNITITIFPESQNSQQIEGQILNSGMLFIKGKQMPKID